MAQISFILIPVSERMHIFEGTKCTNLHIYLIIPSCTNIASEWTVENMLSIKYIMLLHISLLRGIPQWFPAFFNTLYGSVLWLCFLGTLNIINLLTDLCSHPCLVETTQNTMLPFSNLTWLDIQLLDTFHLFLKKELLLLILTIT